MMQRHGKVGNHQQQQQRRPPSSVDAKLVGSVFMGVLYGALAFLLFHWHSLLHATAEDAAVARSILQRQNAGISAADYQRVRADLDVDDLTPIIEKPLPPRTMNHTDMLMTRPEKPIVVAYAISVIKVCPMTKGVHESVMFRSNDVLVPRCFRRFDKQMQPYLCCVPVNTLFSSISLSFFLY